uniref:Uncharacterized protein n=1 Tax=Caenorhabditis japonica TaxID=281687 RepID=A0A8R1ICP0_CAEJA
MKEAVQQWTVLDGKEKKLHDDLAHEIKIEKELRETCDEVSRSVDNLSTKADNNEKERIQLENAFDADLKTEKIAEDNVFQPEKTEEERKELEKMEDAWDSLQEKIRLKEFELTDETEKINEKIRVLEEQRLPTLKQEEKQKQLKIANDYAALQSLTPMYAAYTANLNLNQNLMERLDVSKERKSTLPEVIEDI